jgi:hypothetical protein
VIAIDALSVDHPDRAAPLANAAARAIRFTEHLDLTGTGLLISPEGSDWADMLPHRHHVLALNVLWAEALDAAGRLARRWPGAFAASAAELAARAAAVRDAVRLRFDASGTTDPASAAARIEALGAASFEWGITGQAITALGELPFYLPYVDFRAVGRHCDVTGNLLAVIFGVMPAARAATFLDYLEAIGAADPVPTVAIDPPIAAGSPDHRDYFHWRNLNLPHCYQNGGAWPFIGALHVVAEVVAGRPDRAEALFDRLAAVCLEADFPEWCHGRTGRAMGEPRQLWSATGALYALEAIERGALPRGGR